MEMECPLCGDRKPCRLNSTTDVYLISCNRCSPFYVTRTDIDDFLTNPRERPKHHPDRLAALCRAHAIGGGQAYFIQFTKETYPTVDRANAISAEELLANWPRTFQEKLDRILVNFVYENTEAGQPVHRAPNAYNQVLFTASDQEGGFHLHALRDAGLIRDVTRGSGYIVTPKGFARFDFLQRGTPNPKNPAFVAMWFGDNPESKRRMSEVYERGIKPGVLSAGYDATRVDLEEYNEYIMDRVLGAIRSAPFVVADFTGHRTGVYYEAGFARGLGLTVVQCCRKDDFEGAHFDTKQLNHILWDSSDELRERLLHRILRTVGSGPLPGHSLDDSDT